MHVRGGHRPPGEWILVARTRRLAGRRRLFRRRRRRRPAVVRGAALRPPRLRAGLRGDPHALEPLLTRAVLPVERAQRVERGALLAEARVLAPPPHLPRGLARLADARATAVRGRARRVAALDAADEAAVAELRVPSVPLPADVFEAGGSRAFRRRRLCRVANGRRLRLVPHVVALVPALFRARRRGIGDNRHVAPQARPRRSSARPVRSPRDAPSSRSDRCRKPVPADRCEAALERARLSSFVDEHMSQKKIV